MAFFLLGRVDDTLNLLCPDTFSSRQDALTALSRVTAEPGFVLWDAEVLLLDTDSGTPVLLVRPQVASADSVVEADTEPEVVVVEGVDAEPLETVVVDEVIELETPEADALIADEPITDEPIVVAEHDPATEIIPESESESEPEVVFEAEDASPSNVVLEVDDPAIADAIAEEFEAEEHSNAADALKAALSRTAVQMEAEGIVPLESIGAATPELEPATEPDDEPAPVAEQEWPWDVAAETEPVISPEIAFVLSDLEEPSLDDGSILRGSIDDENFAAARPMIMGSYAERREDVPSADPIHDAAPVEPMGMAAIQPVVAPLPSPPGFAVPVVGDAGDIFPLDDLVDVSGSIPDIPEEPATAADSDDRDLSDFILDLGTVPAVDAAVPSADAAGLDEYTCSDCVYEETCPNKDQRLPKDCGSFQWR